MATQDYPWIYCLKADGILTQGPNAGTVLVDCVTEAMAEEPPFEHGTLELARSLAARHRALEPAMKIEIMRKQFRSRPKRHFHYEFVELVP